MKIIEDNAPKDTATILIGNKTDQPAAVSEAEGRSLADYYKIPFVMTSAKSGINVESAFEEMIRTALIKNPGLFDRDNKNRFTLSDIPKKQKRCC